MSTEGILIKEGNTYTQLQVFEMITCCSCGVPFMITAGHRKQLLEEGTSFYCPNGHRQHYTETCKSKIDKQKRELETKEWEIKNLQNRIRNMRETYIEKTQCNKCGKRVKHIDAHMRRVHPND